MHEIDKEAFDQLPLFPCYVVEDQVFLTLQDAALSCKNLTLDVNHQLIHRPGFKWKMDIYSTYSNQLQNGTFERPTLFKEIKAKPRTPWDGIVDFYKRPFGTRSVDRSTLAKMAIEIFERHILRSWDESKTYIMTHSSGYDSRLVSSLLRKNGLTNIYFMCWQPEIKEFLKIMDYQGWDESFIIPVEPDLGMIDYHKKVIDFKFMGAHFCEAECFWAEAALGKRFLSESGIFDFSNVVGINALWSDETIRANILGWPNVGYFIGCYFRDNPLVTVVGSLDILSPNLSREWIQLLLTYKVPLPTDVWKLELLKQVDSNLIDLARFPNARFHVGPMLKEFGHHSYQRISGETQQIMDANFLYSWYCKTLKKEDILPFPDVLKYYDDRIKDYMKAAICEYLINQGCTISL